jgi:hypothetical protein
MCVLALTCHVDGRRTRDRQEHAPAVVLGGRPSSTISIVRLTQVRACCSYG